MNIELIEPAAQKKAAERIYVVNQVGKDAPRLVRAVHQAAALRHVAADLLCVAVASQDDLVELLGAGVKVESVKPQPTTEPT